MRVNDDRILFLVERSLSYSKKKEFKENWPDSEWTKCRTDSEEELIHWHLNKAYTRTSTEQSINTRPFKMPRATQSHASSHSPTGAS